MSYQIFIHKAFNPKHRALITTADRIMRNYQAQGYDLSLRQLYYQFVAHHDLPNTEQNYKMLGTVISDARLAGALDWDSLVDRGRSTSQNVHWESPAEMLEYRSRSFRIDLWEDQDWHVEVMVEKQALEGVLEPVCLGLDVAFTANKGYSSSSAMHTAGQRMKEKIGEGKNAAVIYLGDHDPSGIDMSRDVTDRLMLFSEAGEWDESDKKVYPSEGMEDRFQCYRIALNMPQVRQYNPPPNPAKMTDSRAESYVRRFGTESWELDALDPETLATLVRGAVEGYRDDDKWNASVLKMESMRSDLVAMAADYRSKQDGS